MLTEAVAALLAASGVKDTPPIVIVPVPLPGCVVGSDDYRAWVPARPWAAGAAQLLPRSDIHEVSQEHREQAVRMLERAEVVGLSAAEVTRLTGSTAPPDARSALQPYLIRNVVPHIPRGYGYGGPIRIERLHTSLRIRAALLGCGGFFKNPLVVFLPAAPERVDMDVSAIW